jgi:hypothetical protein
MFPDNGWMRGETRGNCVAREADGATRTNPQRKDQTMNATSDDDLDVGHDLEITKTTRRAAGAGTWVSGTLHGHRFEALVFPEHADNPEWEIGDSRISKLWIQRLADKRQVFNWDRGADLPAADRTVACIVDFLCGGLADFVYAR